MSCQTTIPSRSQWWYHRSGSIFTCLRSTVKPRSAIVSMSWTIAASLGRGEQAVGPVALVEHADVRERLAVEQQPALAHAERAHRGVRRDPVLAHRDGDVVEVRVLGCPGSWVPDRETGRDPDRTVVVVPASSTVAWSRLRSTDGALDRREATTVTSSSAVSRWGTSTRRSTYSRGTGSSQTVCQMPDWAVYQILPRSRRCLPRACTPVSERSRTRTSSTFSPSSERLGDVEGERQVAAGVRPLLERR